MPLPTHRVEVRKSRQGQEWSNDYLIVAADLTAAQNAALLLVNAERAFHSNSTQFLFALVSTVAKGDREFRHVPINLPGTRVDTADSKLPRFNTVRVDLGTADSDPARKYYRPPLREDDVADGLISTTFRTQIRDALVPVLIGAPPPVQVVTNKGNSIVTVTVLEAVQERQIRRRRKKKVPAP